MDHKAFMGHGKYSDEIFKIVYNVLDEHSEILKNLPDFK